MNNGMYVHRCNLFRKIKEYVCKIGRIFMIEFCQKHNSGNEFILQNYGKLITIFENFDMNFFRLDRISTPQFCLTNYFLN